MSRLRLGALLLVATVGLPLASEGQTIPGFREAGHSTRVALFTRSESAPRRRARADLERTDAYLARMEALFGQPLSGRIEYYRYERPEDIAAQTGVYASGLTRVGGSVVHSTLDYHPHELVHAVAGRLGDPGRFFHEGLAVAVGDEGRWGGRDVHELAQARAGALTWRALRQVFERHDADTAYPLAGSFVKHLIEADGLPRVVAFFRACPAGGTRVEEAFRATFARSLEDAFAHWQERLGAGRKEFPTHRNASRVAPAPTGVGAPRKVLGDLRLAPAAAVGTGPAMKTVSGGGDGE